MATRSVDILLRARNEAGPALGQLQKQLGGLKSTIAGLGIGFGVMKVFSELKESLQLFGVQEQAESKLAAVLKATGNAAGYTSDELKRMASELQNVTTFGDETTISAQAVLATFTRIRGGIFREAVESAMDLSAALGQDLQSSVIQLGKALNDPINGVTALRRVGVSFTEQQQQQIKALVQQNRLMDAQKLILAELKTEFGGVARAMADTTSGSMQQFMNAWGDYKEQLGSLLAGPMKEAANYLRELPGNLNAAATAFANMNSMMSSMKFSSSDVGDAITKTLTHPIASANLLLADMLEDIIRLNEFLTFGIKKDFFGITMEDVNKRREEMTRILYPEEFASSNKSDAATSGLAKSVQATVTNALDTALGKAEPEAKNRFGEWLGKLADDLRIRPHQILTDRLAEVFNAAWGGVKGVGEKLAAPFQNIGGGGIDTGSRMQDAVTSPFVRFGFGDPGGGKNPIVGAVDKAAERQVEVVKEVATEVRNLADVLTKQEKPQLELRPF